MTATNEYRSSEWASQIATAAASKLKSKGLFALVVPVSCHVEEPEGCGVHVVQLCTAGIDLQAVSVLQLLHDPFRSSNANIFGFGVALHLDNKPHVRVVFAYVCQPEDLLVPLTRWVLRSSAGSIIVLAPPRAQPDSRPAQMLLYCGDLSELLECGDLEAPGVVEVTDRSICKRMQLVLERLWYWELKARMDPELVTRKGPGKLAKSIRIRHHVTATGKVVCDSFCLGGGHPQEAELPKGEFLMPLASTWAQLEVQLAALVGHFASKDGSLACSSDPATASTPKSRKRLRNKRAHKEESPQTQGEDLAAVEMDKTDTGTEIDGESCPHRGILPSDAGGVASGPSAESAVDTAASIAATSDVADGDSATVDDGPTEYETANSSYLIECMVPELPELPADTAQGLSDNADNDTEEEKKQEPAKCYIDLGSLKEDDQFGWRRSKRGRRRRSKWIAWMQLPEVNQHGSDGSGSNVAGVGSGSSWHPSDEFLSADEKSIVRSTSLPEIENFACASVTGYQMEPVSPVDTSQRNPHLAQRNSAASANSGASSTSSKGGSLKDLKDLYQNIYVPEKKRASSGGGSNKPVKYTRSWADLSEDQDDAEDDVNNFVFEAAYLREQVTLKLTERETERETSWRGVSAVLDELPNKVAGALAGAIAEATGDDLHIPEQQHDVPADHRAWSSMPEGLSNEDTPHGLLSEPMPWVADISELGQWYELRRPEPGMICGVVLTGDKLSSWVEIVKLKVLGTEGGWTDVDGGSLFQACRNAEEPVEVMFEPLSALAVRIYPVVWHGSISLHAALLSPKRDGIILGDEVSKTLREDAHKALAGMITSELASLCKWDEDERPSRSSADIAELVTKIYSIPMKVADAATRFESSVVKAWREKARADDALQEARQWVESIPEDQPLAMAARAQAAAMDQVSEALMVLEELHTVTASSVADSVLRAKMFGHGGTRSERERVHHKLSKKRPSSGTYRGGRSGASSCTLERLETVAENNEDDQDEKKFEFWLDLFLNGQAFRVGGPQDSSIWDPEETWSRTEDGDRGGQRSFSYRLEEAGTRNMLETGDGPIGEIIKLKDDKSTRTVEVNVVLKGLRTSAVLAPLRLHGRDGRSKTPQTECENVVIQRVLSDTDEALSVRDGVVQLTIGKQGWEHEGLYRHWVVSKNEKGSFRFRFTSGLELAADGAQLVLKEVGFDWRLSPAQCGTDTLAVHIVAGNGSLALLPSGLLDFSTDRSRWIHWHIFQHSHGSAKPAAESAFSSYQLEPGDGVFKAANIWRKGREGARSTPGLTIAEDADE